MHPDLATLLAAPSTWAPIAGFAARLRTPDGAALADEVAALLADDATPVAARRHVIHALGVARAPAATAVLLARAEVASGDELAAVLRALVASEVGVPPALLPRALREAPEEALAVACYTSSLAPIVDDVVARLGDPAYAGAAALALARHGLRAHAAAIAARIPGTAGLDTDRLCVALEVLDDPAVVPALRALVASPAYGRSFGVHHALCRLTRREPLVEGGGDPATVFARAWAALDLDAPARPRLERVAIAADGRAATCVLVDGAGALRIDFDPPSPGSAWPRWDRALRLNEALAPLGGSPPRTLRGAPDDRLYDLGSTCSTCEAVLRRLGAAPALARAVDADVRARVADLAAIDPPLLATLEPIVARLRTGHYALYLVDLALVRVDAPEASWLTRRHLDRGADVVADDDVTWPGEPHLQVAEAALAPARATYGIVLPTAPLAGLDPATVDAHAAAIAAGARPAALALAWLHVREPTWCGDDDDDAPTRAEHTLGLAVLDGHHKLAAYARLGVPARVLAIARREDSADDTGRELADALAALAREPGA